MEGRVIWITGLSAAGKTTVATALYHRLLADGMRTILLDGDSLRKIFVTDEDKNSHYTREERIMLSRKYALLCKNLSSQGCIVIIATVSMFKEIYLWNRLNLHNYFEVYLDVPLSELQRRDPKDIYKNFFSGKLKNVVGLDIELDHPNNSDLVVNFSPQLEAHQIVDIIIEKSGI